MRVWVGVVSLACLAVLVIALQQAGSEVRAGGIALGFWFPAATTLLGTLVANRQPENRIAWLLIGIGFAVLVEFFLQLSLATVPTSPSFVALAAIVLVHFAMPAALYLSFLIPLMFPSGRFLTRRQTMAAWPGAAVLLIVPSIVILTEEVGPPYPAKGQAWTIENPVGFLPTALLEIAVTLAIVVLALTAIAGVGSLIARYRQSSVVVKAQIRWMLYSTSIVTGVLLSIPLTRASESVAGGLLLVVAFVSVPVSVTVAITRYRLFEIDRIISRTLSYTIVVAVLAAAFIGLVAVITGLLPAQDSLAVAASTLSLAALFNPLRKRVQSTIDRRFNRSAYQADLIAEAFASRLKERLSATQIVEEWQRTVDESLQPETSGIWIKDTNLRGLD